MKLENLVPPLNLCERIPKGAFKDSALIYFMWERDGIAQGNVVPREMKDQFAKVLPGMLAVLRKEIPSPTLAEILEELPSDMPLSRNHISSLNIGKTRDNRLFLGYRKRGDHSSDLPETIFDANSASAALRMWFEAKGVEK